jgi:hypothetical protein
MVYEWVFFFLDSALFPPVMIRHRPKGGDMGEERRRAERRGDETFEANGRIVHATPNVGAGAAFLDLASKDRDLLERWLRKAAAC